MHQQICDSGVQLSLPFDEVSVLPVLTLQDDAGIYSMIPDGAYYRVRDNFAQIVIVGPMRFTPAVYLEALNDLLDESFIHHYNSFMDPPYEKGPALMTLQRGFIQLYFKKS